jgi:hypothetical protein
MEEQRQTLMDPTKGFLTVPHQHAGSCLQALL